MKKFIILIPLFNDWKSVGKLLQEIDSQTKNWDSDVSIIIINDASTEENPSLEKKYNKIKSVKILNMKKNQVHQRYIATGLMYVSQNEDFDYVIVMDADGEDRPEELNDFLKKSHEIHKLLTLLFAGKLIKFGNFTCLPKDHVKELIKKSYLWNSYSSSVVKTINDRTFIPSIRGVRYVLPSKMNFSALVYHSLTIISVFKKTVIIRSVAFLLVYLFLISSNFSVVTMIPVLLLVFFVLIIFKISMRANLDELNKSLENIGSIEVLGSSDRR